MSSESIKEYPFIICSGHANVPSGMAAKSVYGTMGIAFKINKISYKIEKVDITFVSTMCIEVINDIFIGYDLNKGIEEAISTFRDVFFGLGKKAAEVAIRDAYNQFLIFKSAKEQTNNNDN